MSVWRMLFVRRWKTSIALLALIAFLLISLYGDGSKTEVNPESGSQEGSLGLSGKGEEEKVEYGPKFDRTCTSAGCILNVYTAIEHVFNETTLQWDKVNESLFPCRAGFCTRDYAISVQGNSTGTITLYHKGKGYSQTLKSIHKFNLDKTATIQENELVYSSLTSDIELRYSFYADELKETFIVKSLPTLPFRQENLTILFERRGDRSLGRKEVVMCDSAEKCAIVPNSDNSTNSRIDVPVSFLRSPETKYPVYVDPTLVLNDTNTTFTGYVTFSGLAYTRTIDPPVLRIGRNITLALTSVSHGSFEFNITELPTDAQISELMLKTFIVTQGDNDNDIISIHQIEQRNVSYADTTAGNNLYWDDMGNGTVYNTSTLPDSVNSAFFIWNVTPAADEMETARQSRDWFGFGMNTSGETQIGVLLQQETRVNGRRATNANRRPNLTIVYTQPTACPPTGTSWIITQQCAISSEFTVERVLIRETGWLICESGASLNGLAYFGFEGAGALFTDKSGCRRWR